jgi:hypothetical protein
LPQNLNLKCALNYQLNPTQILIIGQPNCAIIENLEGEINSVGCNELQLRSGHIISSEESNIHQEKENENNIQPTITYSTVVIIEEEKQEGNTVEQQNLDKDVTPPPPFPERMMIEKPVVYPNFDIVGELKNLYVNIPLLQALQDIPNLCKEN